MTRPTMTVEVIFALPGRHWRRVLEIPVGLSADALLRRSGLDRVCQRQTGAAPAGLGVFGRKVSGDHPMAPGERLELYRPLTADPRQRRRDRVAARRARPNT